MEKSAARITFTKNGLEVPSHPIIPYLEGDGIGPEIWLAARLVLDRAVESAYGSSRRIAWEEALAGEKARVSLGSRLPVETLDKIRSARVAIKGPFSTPVGGGTRSLNVALRKELDLYVCLRPVRWFEGVPSPLRHPERVNMVIFRENTEDVYAGVEFEVASTERKMLLEFIQRAFPDEYKKIRFPESSALGIKPISREGSERIIRAAIRWAIANNRSRVTMIHKGNIMKYTEGAFVNWGYELARLEFPSSVALKEPSQGKLLLNDMIADAAFAQTLLTPWDFDVLVCTNLNGDYLSDALAAQVGGLGIAPGANLNYETGTAVFEATHGSAPGIAGQNIANPCSLILSGEMMLRHIGWREAAERVLAGVQGAIASQRVTPDFAEMMRGATRVSTQDFALSIIDHM